MKNFPKVCHLKMMFIENFLRLTVTIRLQKLSTSKTRIFLNDSNKIQTINHLGRKRTLNHLPKLPKWSNECSFTNYVVVGSNLVAVT